MKAMLHVASGPLAGRRLRIRAEEPLRVGRSRADLVISQDEQMAAAHFELSWDGASCRLRNLSRQGTELDGQTVRDEAEVKSGGWIVAGGTRFLLRLQGEDLRAELPPAPPRRKATPEIVAARQRALEILSGETNLFAILDAARDRRVRALLSAADDEHRSLYEGRKGEPLAEVAPYLVRIERGSPLLEVLVNEGWGESWGLYLTSARPFAQVRQRLRRSLMVQDEETGKRLYFRFYDPRVLRDFLPTCTPRQRSEIFGTEIERFLMEGSALEVLSP